MALVADTEVGVADMVGAMEIVAVGGQVDTDKVKVVPSDEAVLVSVRIVVEGIGLRQE